MKLELRAIYNIVMIGDTLENKHANEIYEAHKKAEEDAEFWQCKYETLKEIYKKSLKKEEEQ